MKENKTILSGRRLGKKVHCSVKETPTLQGVLYQELQCRALVQCWLILCRNTMCILKKYIFLNIYWNIYFSIYIEKGGVPCFLMPSLQTKQNNTKQSTNRLSPFLLMAESCFTSVTRCRNASNKSFIAVSEPHCRYSNLAWSLSMNWCGYFLSWNKTAVSNRILQNSERSE